MVQTLAVTDHIDSLTEAEAQFGLSYTDDPRFFPEWSSDLPKLSTAEQQRLRRRCPSPGDRIHGR